MATFVRIGKHVINHDNVLSIETTADGSLTVNLANGPALILSGDDAAELKRDIEQRVTQRTPAARSLVDVAGVEAKSSASKSSAPLPSAK